MGDAAGRLGRSGPALSMPDYDVVIVGAGPVGAVLAKYLGGSGHHVLVLEAGPAVGHTWADYQANVAQYRAAGLKVPNSPYYSPPDAPSPNVLDIRKLTPGSLPGDTGYFVQDGPFPFGTDYLRSQGGTMLHWLGTCLRQTPADFEMRSRYGHGRDWPLSYEELGPYYEAAELELGVAANVEDQHYCGITFRPGYVFPMYRIPPSYLDQRVAAEIDGEWVTIDGARYELLVSSTPQARNSIPNPAFNRGAGYTPLGAHGAPHEGLRCQGNSSCIPICPVQAKYNPLKTWAQVRGNVELRTQCVVSRVVHSGKGEISALEFIPYVDGVPPTTKAQRVTATLYILAGNPIENAKLLLASEVPNSNDLIGRNLMDHPYLLAWALMPESVGAFRGPSSTSGIEVLRDGPFRTRRAAFRMELVNWGWDFAAMAPYSDVQQAVGRDGLFGAALRKQLASTVPRQFHLGFLYEQLPNPRNRVYIDRAYVDPLGIPRPRLEYHLDDYTRAGMAASRELWTQLFAMLGASDSTKFWEADPCYFRYEGEPYTFHGAGHIVGTHRMGDAPDDSVVDRDQRSWEHPNLYLVGCGSMPTVATSNPSLTMMALALRTLEALQADLGTVPGSRA